MGDYHLLLRVETGGDGRIDRVAQERGAVGVEEAARRVLAHDLGSLAFARVPAISATMRRPIDSSLWPLAQQRRVTAQRALANTHPCECSGRNGCKETKENHARCIAANRIDRDIQHTPHQKTNTGARSRPRGVT